MTMRVTMRMLLLQRRQSQVRLLLGRLQPSRLTTRHKIGDLLDLGPADLLLARSQQHLLLQLQQQQQQQHLLGHPPLSELCPPRRCLVGRCSKEPFQWCLHLQQQQQQQQQQQ
jgi:hypothetical protein